MSRKLYQTESQNYVINQTVTNTTSQDSAAQDYVPVTVTLSQESSLDNVVASKMISKTNIFNDVTIAGNLILLNENPVNSGFDIDRVQSYLRQQIGFYFPYKQTLGENYGFMGFINNTDSTVSNYT